jgi:hypothetical protein
MFEEIIKSLSDNQTEALIAWLKEEMIEGKKPLNFKTEGKSDSEIASEARAREMAAKMIVNLINRIRRARIKLGSKIESYK